MLLMALHSKSDAWCVRSTDEMTSVFCSTSSYVDGSTLDGGMEGRGRGTTAIWMMDEIQNYKFFKQYSDEFQLLQNWDWDCDGNSSRHRAPSGSCFRPPSASSTTPSRNQTTCGSGSPPSTRQTRMSGRPRRKGPCTAHAPHSHSLEPTNVLKISKVRQRAKVAHDNEI